MKKVYPIQALRFLAAFMVVVGHTLIHTNLRIGGFEMEARFFGWIGGYSVMIFFAISGYVITLSCQKISASAFFTYRVTRIYLGYFFAIAVMLIAKHLIWGGSPPISLGALTLLPVGEVPYPLWIEWSLVFEVVFYVLFSLAWIPRSNRVIQVAALLWLIAIFIGGRLGLDGGSERFTFLSAILFNYHNLAFIFGIFLYYGRGHINGDHWLPCAIVAFGVGWGAIVLTTDNHVILLGESLSGGLVLVLALMLESDTSLMRGLARLGDYSYGIYLLHTSIITILLAKADLSSIPQITTVIAIAGLATAGSAIFGYLEFHGYHLAKAAVRSLISSPSLHFPLRTRDTETGRALKG